MKEQGSMKIAIHNADCCQNPKNCFYPHEGVVQNAEQFRGIVAYDHVFFDFRDNYRSLDRFLGAVDCDNDHSENNDTAEPVSA